MRPGADTMTLSFVTSWPCAMTYMVVTAKSEKEVKKLWIGTFGDSRDRYSRATNGGSAEVETARKYLVGAQVVISTPRQFQLIRTYQLLLWFAFPNSSLVLLLLLTLLIQAVCSPTSSNEVVRHAANVKVFVPEVDRFGELVHPMNWLAVSFERVARTVSR